MVLPEEIPEVKERKGMDWKSIGKAWITMSYVFVILIIGVAVGYYSGNPQPSYWVGQMEGLGNDLNQLKQGQGVLWQGEIELAKGIQDINSKLVLNEQALQSLDYLSKNCERTDENQYFTLRCVKQ